MYYIITVIKVSGSVYSQYIQHYVRMITIPLNILKHIEIFGCLQIFIT
jgi:hypothetical protein